MKNITVSVDDATYRLARAKAAAGGTTVSAIVGAFLTKFAGEATDFDRLARRERALREGIVQFSAGDRVKRDSIQARR